VFSCNDESLDAFPKTLQSTVSNNLGAASLIECGCPVQTASVAIAALEEIGKMMLVDDRSIRGSAQPRLEDSIDGPFARALLMCRSDQSTSDERKSSVEDLENRAGSAAAILA
jgi:hypothetical protein